MRAAPPGAALFRRAARLGGEAQAGRQADLAQTPSRPCSRGRHKPDGRLFVEHCAAPAVVAWPPPGDCARGVGSGRRARLIRPIRPKSGRQTVEPEPLSRGTDPCARHRPGAERPDPEHDREPEPAPPSIARAGRPVDGRPLRRPGRCGDEPAGKSQLRNRQLRRLDPVGQYRGHDGPVFLQRRGRPLCRLRRRGGLGQRPQPDLQRHRWRHLPRGRLDAVRRHDPQRFRHEHRRRRPDLSDRRAGRRRHL